MTNVFALLITKELIYFLSGTIKNEVWMSRAIIEWEKEEKQKVPFAK
jgi:hypothetical protein